MWNNRMFRLAVSNDKQYRKKRMTLILVAVVFVYWGTFAYLIRDNIFIYPLDKTSIEEKPVITEKRSVILYFSTNRQVNETLYLAFFPCVEMALLNRVGTEFAHGGEMLGGVTDMLANRPYDREEAVTFLAMGMLLFWLSGGVRWTGLRRPSASTMKSRK
jgi:hypothetical protein